MSHFYDDLSNSGLISVIDELSFWSAPFGLKLLDVVRYKGNMKALDIGCGLGFPLIELSMRLGKTSRVYGLDPWKAGIGHVRQKIRTYGLSNVEVVEGRAEEMPFEESCFDLIVSNNGINNVKNLEKTLEECGRVSKTSAQFVFTFNTDRSFIEFYDTYREVLKDCGMEEYQKKLFEHIYSKRKPLSEFKDELEKHSFKVISIYDDIFHYRFFDATAMLDHFFMKFAFMPSWKEIIPDDRQEELFQQIENRLNAEAERSGGFSMQVPFVTMDCEKEK
jgi:ubiquinone/menaquinone biosynthesis C-methylase UbiE